MTTTNITNFRKNAFNYVEQTIKYNEPLNISTKEGGSAERRRLQRHHGNTLSGIGTRNAGKTHGRDERTVGRVRS